MRFKNVKLSYGEGRYTIDIAALITSDGIAVTITGGEKPHVGGTALSVPRRREGSESLSCDTWITPRPGHKDSDIASMVSKLICLETGQAVACIAGIHIDQAESREIELLLTNSREAALLISHKIKELIG